MEGIFMTKREQYRYQLVEEFLRGKMSRREVAQLLQIRERSVSRLASRIRMKGLMGAVHGNRGREPVNKLKVDSQAVRLIKERYFDFNMRHCLEQLEEKHSIVMSYTSFRRLCHREKLVKRRQKRRAKVHKRRERMSSEGMLIQFDGSHHQWVHGQKWCLIAGIDDATSQVAYAEFSHAETTLSCMSVLHRHVEKKGIPIAIYVDKAGWFGGMKRQNISQLQRACGELGINVIFAHSPQAKGRIERFWGTLQDRLIPEMRLQGIKTIEAANRFLQQEFLPRYWNKRHTVAPRLKAKKYRKAPAPARLREIFCLKQYRTVRGDHMVFWGKYPYRVEAMYCIKGQEVEFRIYPDGSWKSFFRDKPIELAQYSLAPAQEFHCPHLRPGHQNPKVTKSLAT
jgi:transposase